jgi:hypothetical protein
MTSKTQKASIPRRHIANTVTEECRALLRNGLDPETQVLIPPRTQRLPRDRRANF